MNGIQRIVSESCGSSFDARIEILKKIAAFWREGFTISVYELTAKTLSDPSENNQLSAQMCELSVSRKTGTTKKILSVPEKRRRFVKPLIKEISGIICTFESLEFNKKHEILEDIKHLWNSGSEIVVKKVDMPTQPHAASCGSCEIKVGITFIKNQWMVVKLYIDSRIQIQIKILSEGLKTLHRQFR